jgi:uncharacterized coiled-coil protein SlyX
MSQENMNSIIEARLVAAAAAEARLSSLLDQLTESLVDLRNQVASAQAAHMRVYETPPHRRSSDAPRASGPLTFDAAEKVEPSKWPPRDRLEQLP